MTSELLDIQPRELKFVFELKKQSSCSIQLANRTSQHVAFKVKTTSPKKYCVRPNVGIVKPSSSSDFTVTMQAQRIAPPDMQCRDKFLIQSTVVPFGTTEEDITSNMFTKDCGKYIEEKKLKVVLVSPPQSPVLLPLNCELRQEFRNGVSVQKERIPNGPASNGDLKKNSYKQTSVQRDGVESEPPIERALKQDSSVFASVQNDRASSEIRTNEELKKYSHNEASAQEDGAHLERSNDKGLEQDLCYNASVPNDRLSSGLQINEQLKIFPYNDNFVQEDGVLSRRSDDKELKQALHHGTLEDKDSLPCKFPVHKELKQAPLNDISEENAEVLNVAPKDEELKHDSSSQISLQEDTGSKNVAPSLMVAEVKEFEIVKETDDLRMDKHVETMQVEEEEEVIVKDFAALDLAKDCEDLKSKLTVMESKLKEAELTITKLREERIMTTGQKDNFKKELEILRKNSAIRIQVGFPFLYVCMVALISLGIGYYSHP